MLLKHLCFLLFMLFYSSLLHAQYGMLDNAFDSDGVVVFDVNQSTDVAYAVLELPTGKILVAGETYYAGGRQTLLMRYNSDGSLDTGFGNSGVIFAQVLGSSNSIFRAIALQPNGKIVLGGAADFGNGDELVIARFTTDGVPDASFGAGGFVTVSLPGFGAYIDAIELQADGKIVAGGSVNNDVQFMGYAFVLARFNVDGTLDSSFGSAGIVTTDIVPGGGYNSLEQLNDICLQANGKIVATGYSDTNAVALRYTSNGDLDSTFGTMGLVTLGFGASGQGGSGFSAVEQDANGKLLFSGYTVTFTFNDMLLVRLEENGSLDPVFGNGGAVITHTGTSRDAALDLELQPDGKIIIAGFSVEDSLTQFNNFALVRYDSLGNLDPTFGNNGVVHTIVDSSSNAIQAITLQADGKVLAVGHAENNSHDIAMARYNTGLPSGVEESFRSPHFSVYPNPTNSSFQIDIGDQIAISLELYNASGERVLSIPKLERVVAVDSLPKGIYFVRLTTKSGSAVKRLVKL